MTSKNLWTHEVFFFYSFKGNSYVLGLPWLILKPLTILRTFLVVKLKNNHILNIYFRALETPKQRWRLFKALLSSFDYFRYEKIDYYVENVPMIEGISYKSVKSKTFFFVFGGDLHWPFLSSISAQNVSSKFAKNLVCSP